MERAKNAPAQRKLCKGVYPRGTTLFRAAPHGTPPLGRPGRAPTGCRCNGRTRPRLTARRGSPATLRDHVPPVPPARSHRGGLSEKRGAGLLFPSSRFDILSHFRFLSYQSGGGIAIGILHKLKPLLFCLTGVIYSSFKRARGGMPAARSVRLVFRPSLSR